MRKSIRRQVVSLVPMAFHDNAVFYCYWFQINCIQYLMLSVLMGNNTDTTSCIYYDRNPVVTYLLQKEWK